MPAQQDVAILDVCIVTYNSEETIERCVLPLCNDALVANVRIIDNASRDQTVPILRRLAQAHRQIDLVISDQNLGFPAGCNILLRRCTSPQVLLLNPDVEVPAGVLAQLSNAVRADSSIGVITCQLRTRDGVAQSEPARPTPTVRRLVAMNLPTRFRSLLKRLMPAASGSAPLDEVRDVGATMGALMLMPKTTFDRVGLLDESVFMYLEDLDFSARVRAAGLRINYRGDLWAWHDSGVSSAPISDALYSLMPKVWLSYFHRYGTPVQSAIIRPVLVLICAAGYLAHLPAERNKYRGALRSALSYQSSKGARW